MAPTHCNGFSAFIAARNRAPADMELILARRGRRRGGSADLGRRFLAEQGPDAVALLVQFLQGRVHSGAAEFAQLYALDDLVPAAFAGYRLAVDHAFRNPVAPVRGDAHADPVAGDRKSTRLNSSHM